MILLLLGAVLIATILAGLWRIVVGPTYADRMLAIQLFGTAGAAILLVSAQVADAPALRDAGLVLALLAAVVSAALVQFLRHHTQQAIPSKEKSSKEKPSNETLHNEAPAIEPPPKQSRLKDSGADQ